MSQNQHCIVIELKLTKIEFTFEGIICQLQYCSHKGFVKKGKLFEKRYINSCGHMHIFYRVSLNIFVKK